LLGGDVGVAKGADLHSSDGRIVVVVVVIRRCGVELNIRGPERPSFVS
jgi:hypothetical protein